MGHGVVGGSEFHTVAPEKIKKILCTVAAVGTFWLALYLPLAFGVVKCSE